MNSEYRIAFSEVHEVLRVSNKDIINLIPKHFIKFIEENKDDNHVTKLDPYLSLNEQAISPKARAIIALIYRSYIASEEEQIKFAQKDQEEFDKEDTLRQVKYDPDKIFKSIKEDLEIHEEDEMQNEKDPEIEMALELIDKGPIGKIFVKIKYFIWKIMKKN